MNRHTMGHSDGENTAERKQENPQGLIIRRPKKNL